MRGVAWIGAGKLASKEPVSHLDPERSAHPSGPRLPGGPRLGVSSAGPLACGRSSLARAGEKRTSNLEIKQYANQGVLYAMAARSKIIISGEEPIGDRDFSALEEDDESTAEELHALVELEKSDFISLDEYLKRRGID